MNMTDMQDREKAKSKAFNKRLGKGLAALMGDAPAIVENMHEALGGLKTVPVSCIHPNPNNPRRHFAADDLENLSASIRRRGVMQPLLVRALNQDADHYELIAGERRWRAAQHAGIHDVPIIILEVDDKEALEIAIVENVQRTDLNPVEEALGYQNLIDKFGYSQTQVSDLIGKSRPHIANHLRLLNLPQDVLELVKKDQLTAGHARALVTVENASDLARQIVKKGLSVRQAEKLVLKKPTKKTSKSNLNSKDADSLALEQMLSDSLGLKVVVNHNSNNTGALTVYYTDLDQLDEVCVRLKGHN